MRSRAICACSARRAGWSGRWWCEGARTGRDFARLFARGGVAPAAIREFPENRENNIDFCKFPAVSTIADVDLRSNSMALDASSRCIRNREFFCRNRESFRPNREFAGLAVRARFPRRRPGEASVAPADAAKTLDGFVPPN